MPTTSNIYGLTDTWNDGATTFVAIQMDVTDTASAAASKLIDLQKGSVSQFNVDKDGNLTLTGTVDGRDVAADGTKLDGIEAGAKDDQTGAEIKALYEAEANAFTDAQFTKLAGIEANATADQTGAEIKTALFAESDTNNLTDARLDTLDSVNSRVAAMALVFG